MISPKRMISQYFYGTFILPMHFHLAVIDAIPVKVLEDCIFILLIAVCAEANLIIICWLLRSFSYEQIEFIAYLLYPFSNGKC